VVAQREVVLAGAGPVPGWSSAVRVPSRGCWPALERCPRPVRSAVARVGSSTPVTAPWVEWIFTEACARSERGVAGAGAEPSWRAMPAARGRGTERASFGGAVDRADGDDDLGEPAVHGPAGVEPAEHEGAWFRWSWQRSWFRGCAMKPGKEWEEHCQRPGKLVEHIESHRCDREQSFAEGDVCRATPCGSGPPPRSRGVGGANRRFRRSVRSVRTRSGNVG